MATRPKRPRDLSQLAKLIVDISTGERPNDSPRGPDTPMIQAKRNAGLKGSMARAKKLSATKRRAIAKKAALSRWRRNS